MKKIISGSILLAILCMVACEKKVNPVDSSNAVVTLKNDGAKYVTDNITVNAKDSLFFSFTITSDMDMKYVSIQKNPTNQTAFLVRDTVTDANKHTYTATKKLVADSANGTYIYRIVAHTSTGIYIGHKDIVVTVSTDFNFYTYRFMRVPDTTAKVNPCYLSATTGEIFNYTAGAAKSSLIDFGLMYDTTGAASVSTTDDLKFCLYALSAPQSQLSYYDISTFTKNATIMKKATTPAFTALTSTASLRAAATTNLASGTSSKVTQLIAGNLVFFRTASGKAGCLLINFVNDAGTAKESYINIDVKIEK